MPKQSKMHELKLIHPDQLLDEKNSEFGCDFHIKDTWDWFCVPSLQHTVHSHVMSWLAFLKWPRKRVDSIWWNDVWYCWIFMTPVPEITWHRFLKFNHSFCCIHQLICPYFDKTKGAQAKITYFIKTRIKSTTKDSYVKFKFNDRHRWF